MEKNAIRLRFLGAVGTVTGSCTLLEYSCPCRNEKRYFLIDAGVFQNEGKEQESERKNVLKQFAEKIERIFITHAHLDHIGFLPEIVRYGFMGRIICTQATMKLIKIMLENGEGADKINRKQNYWDNISFDLIDGRHGDNPIKEAGREYIPITRDFRYGYLRTSHVLGACSIYFQWTEENYTDETDPKDKDWKFLYFSGDIGPVSHNVMANIVYKDYQTPYWGKDDTCIILESTYGDKIRPKENIFKNKIDKLSEIIDSAISRGGRVIIPAFSLDRAQQILIDLYYIQKNKEDKMPLPIKNDNNWRTILIEKNISIHAVREDITLISDIFKGEYKKEIRRKITKDNKEILDNYKIKENIFFKELDEKCQDEIAEVFRSNYPEIPPLGRIKKNVNSQIGFSFDSPLIDKINKIYMRHLTDEVQKYTDKERKFKYLSDEFLKEFAINDPDFFEKKNSVQGLLEFFLKDGNDKAKIIVTSAGMCDDGKVLIYLEKYLCDETATIIFTGYTAKGTNGWLLKKIISNKSTDNSIDDDLNEKGIPLQLPNKDFRLIDVKCKLEDMSDYYSGHADQEQLLDYLDPIYRKTGQKLSTGRITILLNHGTDTARKMLKQNIEEKYEKYRVILPNFNKWLDISSFEEFEPEDTGLNENVDKQFSFAQVGGIHIYYPKEYGDEKIQSITNYINGL